MVKALRAFTPELEIVGLDNLSRRGSEQNRRPLEALGARIFHGDVRNQSDLQMIPQVDWVIDAAANPSVLIGADGRTSSRQADREQCPSDSLNATTHSRNAYLNSSIRRISLVKRWAAQTTVRDGGAIAPYALPTMRSLSMVNPSQPSVAEQPVLAPPVELDVRDHRFQRSPLRMG